MSPALQQLVRDMNEDTWFSMEGSSKITGMFGGCRPGEPIADLVFVFMFGKVLKDVREVVMGTEFGWTLRYDENQYVEARTPQRKKLRRLIRMTVSISSGMRTRRDCWQQCGSQL